jgi:hypothetical protein
MITKPEEIKGKGINLLKIREINKGSIVLGFNLEVTAIETIYRECLLIKKKEGGHFFTFPSKEYEKDGQKKRMSLIDMPKERKDKLEKIVIEMISEYYPLS